MRPGKRASIARAAVAAAAAGLVALGALAPAAHASAPDGTAAAGAPPVATVAPFVLLLAAIAVLPLAAPHFWESNRSKAIVSLGCAIPGALIVALNDAIGASRLLHAGHEYFSFVTLIGSLYVIAGGIAVRGTLHGTPALNAAIFAIGAVMANLIGTTGASMLLVRPLLRANEWRKDRAHVVIFFIFCVCNLGGLLTPLGDPPLFLGFLNGVPFEWTLRLLPEWAFANVAIIAIFLVVDTVYHRREKAPDPGAPPVSPGARARERFRIEGGVNFLFLLGVVAAIYFSGRFRPPPGVQEAAMLAMAGLSLALSPRAARTANRFGWHPIVEVAVLFAGIFVTMIPALVILNARGGELGLAKPWHFFWITGVLSSFLDNAPTYLTFASTACGVMHVNVAEPGYLARLIARGPEAEALLAAVSTGAVFMGANTYIGNGPNFMVKAIAEESGVKMPSFFGYMVWSTVFLIPLFVVVTWLFFR